MRFPILVLFFLILLPLSCTKTKAKKSVETDITANDEYLHIGGLRYNHKLSELDGITGFWIKLHPLDKEYSNSLDGIELLENITELTIMGVGEMDSLQYISDIDFSPLKSLKKLKELRIAYLILNEMPDLSGIPSLESVYIQRCKILSLNGIEKANQIKQLKFLFFKGFLGDFSVLSALTKLEDLTFYYEFGGEEMEDYIFHVSDLSGITGLKYLYLGHFSNVDLDGIKNLSRLEYLGLSYDVKIVNIQELTWLRNLKKLNSLNIPTTDTSLSFLASLTNITELSLYGNNNIIDIELLKNMINLEYLSLYNFKILNFQILDSLTKMENVYVFGSIFIPENNNKLKNVMVTYEQEPR